MAVEGNQNHSKVRKRWAGVGTTGCNVAATRDTFAMMKQGKCRGTSSMPYVYKCKQTGKQAGGTAALHAVTELQLCSNYWADLGIVRLEWNSRASLQDMKYCLCLASFYILRSQPVESTRRELIVNISKNNNERNDGRKSVVHL